MKPANFPKRKLARQERAIARQVKVTNNPWDRWDQLDSFYGQGLGANKERAKLLIKMNKIVENS